MGWAEHQRASTTTTEYSIIFGHTGGKLDKINSIDLEKIRRRMSRICEDVLGAKGGHINRRKL